MKTTVKKGRTLHRRYTGQRDGVKGRSVSQRRGGSPVFSTTHAGRARGLRRFWTRGPRSEREAEGARGRKDRDAGGMPACAGLGTEEQQQGQYPGCASCFRPASARPFQFIATARAGQGLPSCSVFAWSVSQRTDGGGDRAGVLQKVTVSRTATSRPTTMGTSLKVCQLQVVVALFTRQPTELLGEPFE